MLKRSIAIKGHRTSILLEAEFLAALEEIARRDGLTLPAMIAEIDRRRLVQSPPPGLASALRVYALSQFRSSGIGDKA